MVTGWFFIQIRINCIYRSTYNELRLVYTNIGICCHHQNDYHRHCFYDDHRLNSHNSYQYVHITQNLRYWWYVKRTSFNDQWVLILVEGTANLRTYFLRQSVTDVKRIYIEDPLKSISSNLADSTSTVVMAMALRRQAIERCLNQQWPRSWRIFVSFWLRVYIPLTDLKFVVIN